MTPAKMVICPRCWNHRQPFCDKCNNTGKLPDTEFSKNFVLSEFTYSPTAQRLRIANDLTVKDLDRMMAFTKNLLQPMREQIGSIKITSGFRTLPLNKAIKGDKDSAHLLGYAADTQPQDISLVFLMYWFAKTELPFDQAILEYGRRPDDDKDDWVHIGYKHPSGAQRRQLLVMRNGKYTEWRP